MAPMTRSRAQEDGTSGELSSLYYAQRASMGLLISEGTQPPADMVPVGAWSLANSDLVERLKEGAPLNEADPTTFFGAGSKGCTDYPT